MIQFCAILAAGGASSRFGSDKLQAVLGSQSVLGRSVAAFANRRDVPLVIVSGANTIDAKKVKCVAGGKCRAESVRNALSAVPDEIEWVAIHDAARPLVSQGLIDRVLAAAIQYGAAAPAMPVALTVKSAKGPLPARIERTVRRDELWAMQTPQIARRTALLDAIARCPISLEQVTDDLQLLELAGHETWIIPGEERNLKITTPADFAIAKMMLGNEY